MGASVNHEMVDEPINFKHLQDLDLDDYRALGCMPGMYVDKGIESVSNTVKPRSSHSQGGVVNFFKEVDPGNLSKDRRLRLWGKQFLPPTDLPEFYQRRLGLDRYDWELEAIRDIEQVVGKDLTPRIKAQYDPYSIIWFSYVSSQADRERLIDCIYPGRRRAIKYEAHRAMAIMDGRFRALEREFKEKFQDAQDTEQDTIERITHYFVAAKYFQYMREGRDVPEDPDEVKRLINIEHRVNIDEIVFDIVVSMRALEFGTVPGNGDCRVDHFMSGEFEKGNPQAKIVVDWERFGGYKFPTSHVTYASAEGRLSELPEAELQILGGWVIAYRGAAMEEPRSKKSQAVAKLDRIFDRYGRRKIVDHVSHRDRACFAIQFNALDLLEQLRLDSANKSYSPELRERFRRGIKGWDEKKMLEGRLAAISRRLNYAAFASSYKHMGSQKTAKRFFYLFADAMQRLELVDSDQRCLETLSG